ncbi:MAG: dipeptide epimerase [Chitinophagales bacterium]
MKLSITPFQLRFKYPFRIAHGMRTHTDVVYVKLEHKGCVAWGEATLPPYLPETQQTVADFINTFAESNKPFTGCSEWRAALLVDTSNNMAAKAALDMALWQLQAQLEVKSVNELLGIEPLQFTYGTYTIGVCALEEMKVKIAEAESFGFAIFKIKLDGKLDEEMIANYKMLSNKPFAVDVNQGWKTVEEAERKIEWLKEEGCLLVEQPLQKDSWQEMRELKAISALPLYADEACQRITDIDRVAKSFHGVNVKLMKCGGITEAYQMILKARQLNLKVLIGCMSESSVGCTAAAALTPLADYADLDGPYLIANDPFEGMKIEKGRVVSHPLTQFLPRI